MERNYDEVIAEMLMELDQIHQRGEKLNKRLDLTIKRMVKAEDRMEDFDKKLNQSILQLEQSIKDHRSQSQLQAKANAFFLKQLTQQGKLLDTIIRKNGLKT
jgi:predicted  nucleic acid-binding Zn-ribbon protein